jgi:hypothetical protein
VGAPGEGVKVSGTQVFFDPVTGDAKRAEWRARRVQQATTRLASQVGRPSLVVDGGGPGTVYLQTLDGGDPTTSYTLLDGVDAGGLS